MAKSALNSRAPIPATTWSQGEKLGMAVGVAVGLAAGWLTYSSLENTQLGALALAGLFALIPTLGAIAWARQSRDLRALQDHMAAVLDRQSTAEATVVKLAAQIASIEISTPVESYNEDLAEKIRQIASAQQQTEKALAVFMSARAAEDRDAAENKPRPLVLETYAAAPPLPFAEPTKSKPISRSDLILAANFPKTADDRVGFAAMRLALNDVQTKPFIHAAQDILTLLSQDGIYMDDLTPERARAEVWRHFAEGQRGLSIAPLGGIRDRKIIEKVATRMRADSVFRDTAHHFLRHFDKTFASFAETARDADISAFAETRSARAFMLLGRIAGTFD